MVDNDEQARRTIAEDVMCNARRLREELGRERAVRIARYRARKWIQGSYYVRPEAQAYYRAKGAAWWRAAVRLERSGESPWGAEQ